MCLKTPIFEVMNHVLKKAPSWVNYFGISESEALELISKLEKGQCLARHLLESGRVSAAVWDRWAKGHFKLPTLKPGYQANEHQKLLHERYANLFPNSIAVLEDWDGVLFLACLAPLEDFQAPQKFQWILVSLEQLKQLRYEKSIEEAPVILDDGMPTGLNLADIRKSDSEVQADPLPEIEPKIFDAPSGIFDIAKIKSELAGESEPIPSSEEKMEKTTAFDLDFSTVSLADEGDEVLPPPLVPKAMENPIPELEVTREFSPVTVAPPEMPPLPSLDVQPPPLPPQVPHVVSMSVASEPESFGYTSSGSGGPPPVPTSPLKEDSISIVSPINHGVAIGAPPAPSLGGKSSIDSTISSAAIEDIVKDMNQHFERAMLLLFHNSELKVWKASDRWEQDKTRDTNIDLSIPSVFRIVKETKLPYHGHVVGNPINDAFFMTWSKGKTPEHLTIVPVLYEKNLIGMLLGATTKERASQISLERVQGLGLEAGLTLISQAAA